MSHLVPTKIDPQPCGPKTILNNHSHDPVADAAYVTTDKVQYESSPGCSTLAPRKRHKEKSYKERNVIDDSHTHLHLLYAPATRDAHESMQCPDVAARKGRRVTTLVAG